MSKEGPNQPSGFEIEDPIEELYRDELATVDKSGKRIWIYPKKPKGKFYQYRKYVSYLLLLTLFGLPFIKMNGEPFVLLNIPEAKFILFGVYFAPQDFHLFVIAMLSLIVFIVLFTVIYGRLFCGWICPQTIFMEMVFRRIEYWVEGDARAQKKLDNAPWNAEKIGKKAIKQGLFILVSILITHTFLSYIIGIDEVWNIIQSPIQENIGGFVAMVLFTIVFYGVFSVMREQVCTTICPYGRLQGVMLDQNSLAVSYDFVRGEPSGKIKRKGKRKSNPQSTQLMQENGNVHMSQTEKKGDCIDCGLCVQVCPTGIDIRNGTQLECINCTACMDVCDEVMEKVDRPTGLIRIDSYNGIIEGYRSIWNLRVMAYSGVLLALIALETFLFMNRSDVETLLLRTPGILYQENDDGTISNLYNYQLINKSEKEMEIRFVAKDRDDVRFEPVGKAPTTEKNRVTEGAVFIKIPEENVTDRKTNLRIEVYGNGELIDETRTTFLGPMK